MIKIWSFFHILRVRTVSNSWNLESNLITCSIKIFRYFFAKFKNLKMFMIYLERKQKFFPFISHFTHSTSRHFHTSNLFIRTIFQKYVKYGIIIFKKSLWDSFNLYHSEINKHITGAFQENQHDLSCNFSFR